METPEKTPPKRPWIIRVLLSKTLIITAALIAAYTLVGFFLAPWLVHRYAVQFADEKLKCGLSIGDVRINPYALTLEIKGFDLKEKSGAPLIAFEDFFVNLQASSLWNWALTFVDLRLDKPSVNVVLTADGGVNLIDILDRIPKEADNIAPKAKGPEEADPAVPRMILERIALNQGRLVITDLSGTKKAGVALEPINLEVESFTTLPDQKGRYAFQATLPHGGKFRWRGEISTRPLWSEGEMEIKDFRIATVWEFLQDQILMEKPEGKASLRANYRFSQGSGGQNLLVDRLGLEVSDLSLKMPHQEEPFFAMNEIRVEDGLLDLSSQKIYVGQVSLSHGRVAADVDDHGQLNFQKLIPEGAQPSPPPPKKESQGQSPWQIDFKSIGLDGVSLKFLDQDRTYPAEITAADLGVKLKAHLSYGAETLQAVMEDADVTLSDVSMREVTQTEPLIHLDKLLVKGTRFDLEDRRLDVEKVSFEGGHARMIQERGGGLNLARVLGGAGKGTIQKETAEAVESAKAEMKPWAVTLGAVEMTGFGVGFKDQTLSPSPAVDVENLALKVTNIKNDFTAPLPFEASLSVRQGGKMSAKGEVHLGAPSAKAAIQVSKFPLTPFQPYLAQMVLLSLDSGTLSLKGDVAYSEKKKALSASFGGDVDIDNLQVSETATGQRFLSWKQMAMNRVSFSLGPDRINVGEVRLIEPYGKLIIQEDKSLSVKNVLRPQEKKPEPTQTAHQKRTPDGFPVNVKNVRIEKGGLDFADLSLMPQFAAKIRELKGTIAGLSTKEGHRAQVQLDGRVDAYGSSKIRGQLEPSNPKHFTDVSVVFRNVEMTNLTPYSAKFAGYRIASGKLSLDLRYLIEDSELKGENQIILDKLTLGEKVDSPDAPDLPLELALALLKDSEDRIDIGLPVSGNIDDPQFTYGHLIWKALLNLFQKIITAPFRALASMLGIDSENLDMIGFEPGESLLAPPEQEMVKNLSEALVKRPQLMLNIEGGYDPESDSAALTSLAIKAEIAKKTGRKQSPDEEPGPMNLNDPLTQKAIDNLVTERLSPQVLAAAKEEAFKRAAAVSKKGEKEARPGLPPGLARELYESLLQKLWGTFPVTEADLKDLGQKRAEEIRRAVVQAGQVSESRVSVLESVVAGEKGKGGVGSKLSLDVAH